jgi:phosphopantothenoylcysteine synthetase/decarboxylase
MRVLITSGGTKVPIDGVRDISHEFDDITNMSHGTFGAKIAREFLNLSDAEVLYLGAKDGCSPFKMEVNFAQTEQVVGMPFLWTAEDAEQMDRMWKFLFWCQEFRTRCQEYTYRTYEQYSSLLESIMTTEKPDIVILAAAVSDYVVDNPVDGKIRSSDALTIQLKPAEKLISRIKQWHPVCKLVGFKLLVNSTKPELESAALKSIRENGCDLVVANDLADIKANKHTLRLVRLNNIQSVETVFSDPADPNYLAKEVVKKALLL